MVNNIHTVKSSGDWKDSAETFHKNSVPDGESAPHSDFTEEENGFIGKGVT